MEPVEPVRTQAKPNTFGQSLGGDATLDLTDHKRQLLCASVPPPQVIWPVTPASSGNG